MATLFTNVYVIDLYKDGIDIYNAYKDHYGPYWYSAHGTGIGYVVSAEHIMSYTNYIIRNNLMDFKDVQFIGTDYHY